MNKDSYVVFVASNRMGTGEDELGGILMKAFLNTLWESKSKPEKIIFMNDGIRLCVEDSEVLETLFLLEEAGVEILSCGTCLAYYKLTEKLKVGKVSNMREITGILTAATKVVKI